ncbi:MAG: SMI1/KNR4 family protein [Planctomycetes bacterium]|nr:SMI1/KNR4 family protein [Planctomycetota bacterium]
MGRADKIEAEFPPGIRMPQELRRLCDFLDRTDYPISGSMRLRPEGEGLKAWFGDGSDAWRQLAGFGSGPDGSTLALWLYAGTDTSTAPVVHLGSEGDHLMVIADNFRDFLALFGIGYGELGFDDLSKPPAEPETAARLREWLAAEFGISCAATGIELVQHAQACHPDFAQWVRAAEERTITRGEPEAEDLRQRVHRIAEDMIRDGRSRVYTLSSPWWSMDFKIERDGADLSISYLDFGEWYSVPPKYKLLEEAAALLKFVKNKERRQYELSTCTAGIVSVGPNKELVLVPPEGDAS